MMAPHRCPCRRVDRVEGGSDDGDRTDHQDNQRDDGVQQILERFMDSFRGYHRVGFGPGVHFHGCAIDGLFVGGTNGQPVRSGDRRSGRSANCRTAGKPRPSPSAGLKTSFVAMLWAPFR